MPRPAVTSRAPEHLQSYLTRTEPQQVWTAFSLCPVWSCSAERVVRGGGSREKRLGLGSRATLRRQNQAGTVAFL